ncbi:endo-1,4-beta-xylanase [Alkalibacterium sp.]
MNTIKLCMVMLLLIGLPGGDVLASGSVLFEGFEEDSHDFKPRGDDELVERTSDDAYSGSYSLEVSGRSENWNGPAIRIDEYIEVSNEYSISVWVKLLDSSRTDLKLSTQIGDGGSASYQTIDTQTVSSDEWVELSGSYRYDSLGDGYVSVYVESDTHASVAFLIDHFELSGEGDEAVVEVETNLKPLKQIYEEYFLIGNAVSLNEMDGQRLELLNHHHNLVTAENAMKPEYSYNALREFDFESQMRLIERVEEEGLALHGHVLVWHQQSPEWLHSEGGELLSREDALENMYSHIEETILHYGDSVISWEVVNEAMNDNPGDPENWRSMLRRSEWFNAVGDDYLELAYLKAREVLDENGWTDIKLYYNDYNDDNQNKATAIFHMIKEINEDYSRDNPDELLIDGVGMQGHYNSGTSVNNVRMSIERFRELGIEIGVTELDITTASTGELSEDEEVAQALLYAELFSLYKEHSDIISRVTFWGLNDSTSWRGERNPLLFDGDLRAKESYFAVADPEGYLARHSGQEEVEKRSGRAVYGTPETTGELDEIWQQAESLPIDRYQLAWQGADGVGRVLWDEENLYVLVEVTTPSIDVTGEEPWEQDSVEVFIEESNQQAESYSGGARHYRVNAEGLETSGEWTEYNSFSSRIIVTDEGYSAELVVPWEEITPVVGDKVGFDLLINGAQAGSRESVSVWNDLSGQAYQEPAVFGELELLGEGAGDSANTGSERAGINNVALLSIGSFSLVVISVILYKLKNKE